MGIEPARTQGRAGWSRILISAVLVFAPIALAVILIFGGGQVNRCLGGRCATLPPPEQVPVMGSQAGLIAIVLALSAFWLVAAALAIRFLWLTDRTRLGRATAVSAGLVVATAVVTVVVRLIGGQRLRVAAEDAGLYVIGAAIVATPLALAWAVLTTREGNATDTGRAGGVPPSSG